MGVVFGADTFSLVQIAYIKAFQQIKYMDYGISYLIVLLLNTVINIRFFGGMPDYLRLHSQYPVAFQKKLDSSLLQNSLENVDQ